MRTRSKGLSGFVAIAAASVLVIGACGTDSDSGNKQQSSPGFAACEEKPNECNNGPTKQGGSIVVGLEKTIQTWNVWDADGNTFDTSLIMNAVLPQPYAYQPDNSLAYNKHLFSEEPKLTKQDPQTIVYKLRKETVWNDGEQMTYKDFELFWKMNNGKDCPECNSVTTTGYDQIESVTGSDGDKTVTVTFKKGEIYPDWKGLFYVIPSHLAAKQGDLTTPAGIHKAYKWFEGTPTWSGGPYQFKDYQKDVSVTLVPNPKWYGAKKPALDTITFKIVEDQASQVPALRNKEIQLLYSQPNQDLVNQIRGLAGVNYNLMAGPTWEHIDLNLKNAALADVALRKAIFTAVDRKSIIDKTVGSFFPKAAPLNNHNIMPGAPGYKDVITATGQGKGDIEAAKKILTDAGYKIDGGKLIGKNGQPVPQLRFRYTSGNTGRQQTAELFQASMKQLGIDIKIDPTTTLGKTLDQGDFDIIIFAWVGTPFLADSKENWKTGGGNNKGNYSNPDVDKLLEEAVKTLDEAKMRDLLNQADEIMAKDAYVLPLYQKPVFLAVYSDYINIRNNATSQGQTYNIEDWGLKADS